MTQETLDQRVTALRSDTLALLDEVARDTKTPQGEHSHLISSLQQMANHLGTVQALSLL
jgi:hypothetical protein